MSATRDPKLVKCNNCERAYYLDPKEFSIEVRFHGPGGLHWKEGWNRGGLHFCGGCAMRFECRLREPTA